MNKIPNNYFRVSIKALIFDKEKQFLLVKEPNGLWELPGGGMDFDEEPDECIKRELGEEMGLEATYISNKPSYFFPALNLEKVWKVGVCYEVKVKNLNFTPTEECVEIRFFNKETASKENLYPVVKKFISIFDPKNHT